MPILRNQVILRGRTKLPGSCANVTQFQWFFFAHSLSYITFFVLNLQTWNLRCTHLVSKPTFTPKHIDLSLLLLLQYSVKRKFAENAQNRPGRRYIDYYFMLLTKVSHITRLWTSSLTVKLDAYILLQNLQISLYSCIKKWNACSGFHLFLVLTHGPLHENNSNSCYAIMKSVTNFYVKR